MNGLTALDWGVIALYLAGIVGLGLYVSPGQRSARDYFLAGRSLPWWAATLSIIATETSAATFIGYPALAYRKDWSLLQLACGLAIGRVFVAFVFVPVFYREEYLTVYAYLARRFGERTRGAAALVFLAGRLFSSGVRLFAGCLALNAATGFSTEAGILVLGVLGTAFTFTGGVRAVVWTDVALGITFLIAASLALAFLACSMPGGVGAVAAHADFAVKTAVVHPSGVLASLVEENSLLAGLAGGFFLTLATHGTDQDMAQRVLVCRDSRSGRLSLLVNAVAIVPTVALFLGIGTLLYFFAQLGAPSYPAPENPNHIFPLYIVHELPAGVRGFVLAGLVAAALSSFTSVLSALSSATISDLYVPALLRRGIVPVEHRLLSASRWATALWGGAVVLAALAFVGSGENVLELAMKTLTYVYGSLLGVFLLGILTRRGSDASALTGLLVGLPLALLFQLHAWAVDSSRAPPWVRGPIAALPEGVSAALREVRPLAWPFWIVASTLVTFAIGALVATNRTRPGREESSP